MSKQIKVTAESVLGGLFSIIEFDHKGLSYRALVPSEELKKPNFIIELVEQLTGAKAKVLEGGLCS